MNKTYKLGDTFWYPNGLYNGLIDDLDELQLILKVVVCYVSPYNGSPQLTYFKNGRVEIDSEYGTSKFIWNYKYKSYEDDHKGFLRCEYLFNTLDECKNFYQKYLHDEYLKKLTNVNNINEEK